jgi:hypothetical protein
MMTSVTHSLELVFLHPTVAALFAFTGVALGLALRKIALHRLSLLVAAAMGTLLAVTLFDVLPDAQQFLTWPSLLLVCATAMMLMVALGLHCAMDGFGIALGDNVLGHPDVGLVAGMSGHKMPEGLALILLLLGAGIERKKAITWALGVESMTIVGGVIGFYLANSISTFWLGVLFAHVGGGFFYMIASAVRGVVGQHTEEPRYAQHALVSSMSFISSAVLLGLVAK